jgi:hypothetical protein
MRLRYLVSVFAGFGLFFPIALVGINDCCPFKGLDSDRWLLLWPSMVILVGDTLKPPTWFETASELAFSIGINIVLYALVGLMVGGLFALVRRLRVTAN